MSDQKQVAKRGVKEIFAMEATQERFKEILGKKSTAFITSVVQIAQSNLPEQTEPSSIVNSALMAATLDLPLNNNLGFAYIIAYEQSVKTPNGYTKKTLAQFQMGYKGIIQLAQRSGQYKTISASPVYAGQFLGGSELFGHEFDFSKRDSDEIIGYAAYFKLINGFEKTAYMTAGQMQEHAKAYSKSFSSDKSIWKKDPVSMGCKTVLKLLLSKYGPLSVDVQTAKAIEVDQSVLGDDMQPQYVDEVTPLAFDEQRVRKMIESSKTPEELTALLNENIEWTDDLNALFEAKHESLTKQNTKQ
ncbi:MAG TPA: recombinase RecT [Anaerolineales bacterium]|nr:recombinase RecT [Anaerolineales bacterium]HNO94176.1 recombinase RecT [Anaerolineales bacterium]